MRTRPALLVLALLAAAAPVRGQVVEIDQDTQIRSVAFDVQSDAIDTAELLDRVSVRGRGGAVQLRQVLRWVPFVPPVEERPFDPEELQRDKERIRRFLGTIGYPDAAVDYEVTLDEAENVVDIVFRIDPGAPVRVTEIRVAWPDTVTVEESADAAMDAVRPGLELQVGAPLDQRLVPPAAAAVGRWLGERGYAFAAVRPEIEVDSAAHEARVTLRARPGPRARVGEIDIQGNTDLRTSVVRGFLPLHTGDPFSPERLQSASQRVSSLDMVRSASFEVPADQTPDSVVDVVLRVREADQRGVSGQIGYATDGGIAGEAQWTHRNFFRGAQTLTASVAGQSGILALAETPDEFLRGSITYRQPIRGRAQLTLNVGPYAEFRDDFRDRSLEFGLETTLVYQIAALSSIALRYRIATRRIYEYRFGDLSGGLDFIDLIGDASEGLLDSLGTRINSSVVTLSASLGELDVPTEPTRGFVIEPSLSLTVPGGLSSTQYVSANIRTSGYLPLGSRVSIGARAGGGRLFPFGKSVPATVDDGLRQFFRLRDVIYTAGGSSDVRGWSDRLLGPKFPDAVFKFQEDSTVVVEADRYVPLGGLKKAFGTIEARLPMPFMGDSWGTHVFLDGGRVWTQDERFTESDDPYGAARFFFGTGAGIDYVTPVGAIRLAIGYKLNPYILDVADPQDVIDAILAEMPIEGVRRHNGRRFQFHIGIGRRL